MSDDNILDKLNRRIHKTQSVQMAKEGKAPQYYFRLLNEQRGDDFIWIRFGQNSEYEKFYSVDEAAQNIQELIDLMVNDGWPQPQKVRWVENGLEIPSLDLERHNRISIFWGDDNAQPIRELSRQEKRQIERVLGV